MLVPDYITIPPTKTTPPSPWPKLPNNPIQHSFDSTNTVYLTLSIYSTNPTLPNNWHSLHSYICIWFYICVDICACICLCLRFAELKANILGPADLYVKSGSDINLTCNISQGPHELGNIFWYKGSYNNFTGAGVGAFDIYQLRWSGNLSGLHLIFGHQLGAKMGIDARNRVFFVVLIPVAGKGRKVKLCIMHSIFYSVWLA